MHTGSCLCGGVRFEIDGELAPIQICHCGQCRKAQGTPFATNVPVETRNFRFTAGEELLRAYQASPGKDRVFCSRCGSPIFSRREALPGMLRVRAGTLDGPLDTRPQAHFQVSSKANWWPITDSLPQFPDSQVPAKA